MSFAIFSGTTSLRREELETGKPEILSTEFESMPVTIETTPGQLILDFEGIRFALDTGQATDYETIERVCDEYWTEWKAKSERPASR